MNKTSWVQRWRLLLIQNSQSGLTLLEPLMAVVVLAVLIAAISPSIVLSMATRIQARRVELGTQAARTYIDGVRNGTIVPPNYTVTLNEVSNNIFSPQRNTFAGVSAPTTGSLTCSNTLKPYCQNDTTSSLYCVDLDGTGCSTASINNFVIQAARSVNPSSNDPNQGYVLFVRVYRANAFKDSIPLKTTAQTNNQQMTYTSGLGDIKAPVVEMTTEIVTSQTTYQNYCLRYGGCK